MKDSTGWDENDGERQGGRGETFNFTRGRYFINRNLNITMMMREDERET